MAKIKVNISTPDNWDFDTFLKLHSPNQKRIWGDFEFFHNQESGTFDFWIVLEKLEKTTKLNVTSGHTFIVTMEEKDVVPSYNQKYLDQFDLLITSRSDVRHDNLLLSHYFTKWHIIKSYDELKQSCEKKPTKTKDLSAIISSRVQYGTHQRRYAFINKLKGHFKSDLDWFSKNENPLVDKWDGLSAYKYSIAIENGSHSKYFTEKLADVLLADAIPIYWGAPDIQEYFPKELIKNIDINDFEDSIEKIEELIQRDDYESYLDLLRESKLKILDEYQFYPWLTKIISEKGTESNKKISKNIYKEEEIEFKSRLKKSIKHLVGYGG